MTKDGPRVADGLMRSPKCGLSQHRGLLPLARDANGQCMDSIGCSSGHKTIPPITMGQWPRVVGLESV